MADLIERQAAIDAVISLCDDCDSDYCGSCRVNYPGEKDARKTLKDLPSAQPEYEELTPQEAASEIASGSIMSARYWLDAMIRLKQMGYAICRKR